jgi:hypothetical protein
MNDIYRLIHGHEQIVDRFGKWPSFHDSEIISLNLDRDDGKALTGPILTLSINLFRLEVAPNHADRRNTKATLKFSDVENMNLAEFNHQNAISDFVISKQYSERLKRDIFNVELKPGFGVRCQFQCSKIEVLSVEPFTPRL